MLQNKIFFFLEAAEDLDIRGLSEANTESLISNREIPFESSLQDITPSPKRKRAAERQQKSRFNCDNPSNGLETNNFINNVNKTSLQSTLVSNNKKL